MSDKGLCIGIEAKIEYNPIIDVLGNKYERLRRTGLNDMQRGMSVCTFKFSRKTSFLYLEQSSKQLHHLSIAKERISKDKEFS